MIKKKNKDLRADWMPDQVGYDIGARRHCEEWNDEAISYRLPRADTLAMTDGGLPDSIRNDICILYYPRPMVGDFFVA